MPGHYELRVSAVSQKLEGSVYLDIEVPDLRAAPLAVSGIALTYAGGARVPVAPPSARRGASPLPFPPSLDRIFTADDELRVYFEGLARGAGRVTAAIEIVNENGKVVNSPSPSFTAGDRSACRDGPARGSDPGAYTARDARDGARSASRRRAFIR